MKNIKLAMFDLDGTLLDTLTDITTAVNHAVLPLGVGPYTNSDVVNMIGDGPRMLLKRALPQHLHGKLDSVIADYTNYYNNHIAVYTKPFDGIAHCLTVLRNNGVKIGVFSNKSDNHVKMLCRDMLSGLVDFAVGTQLNGLCKPDAFGINDILAESGVNRANAVYIGDSTVDIDTARNGGLPCISVSWGYNTVDKLKSHGAENIVDSAEQLIEAILQ